MNDTTTREAALSVLGAWLKADGTAPPDITAWDCADAAPGVWLVVPTETVDALYLVTPSTVRCVRPSVERVEDVLASFLLDD